MFVGWNFCPYRAYIAAIVTALYNFDRILTLNVLIQWQRYEPTGVDRRNRLYLFLEELWSILLLKSDLKWYVHLSRSLFYISAKIHHFIIGRCMHTKDTHTWSHLRTFAIRNCSDENRCLWITNASLPQHIENRIGIWSWPFTYWPEY